MRFDSSRGNDHVASVPTRYIISYSGISYFIISKMLHLSITIVYSVAGMRLSPMRKQWLMAA